MRGHTGDLSPASLYTRPMGGTPRILVADDNVQVLGLVEAILRSAGYDVVLCEGGEPAVQAASAEPFDLILLDGMMPDLDGFETCETLRRLPHHAHTPIVFLTGMTDEGTFEDATEVGADEVLSKPIRRSSLLLRVRSLLRLSRLRAERDQSFEDRVELTELLLGDLERPMNTVRHRARALAAYPDLPPELQSAARDLLGAERSLASVVRNLMDVQRSAEGTFGAHGGDVCLADLLDETVASWTDAAAQKGVTLGLEATPPRAPVWLDEALLGRALDNLVEHALFSAESSILLSATVTPDGATVSVRDDGEPLSPEEQDRLQLIDDGTDTVTGRLPVSRGLGLVLCRLVAEAHDGQLAISSNDAGTHVHLLLRSLPK